ncbi:alpha/beta fold hydrolase [Curtobacterium sp. MCSS17_005]|uniref:alpha/beta fold hydrolase n=1 Tax=Curtobacterium sp. MCSS17_005 TaxID=2175641 RepID=UPI000DA7435F|nr:alpha/beta fold hydrolase [Curtobacterium sp. MCSS17_005]WIB34383.1 alpha/beta fold hydrolase [Curtobacterium sp. MCSS17_005]
MLISTETTTATAAASPAHSLSSEHVGGVVPDTSLLAGLDVIAAERPDALAVADEHIEMSHGELDRVTRALGVLLHERLTPDDQSGRGVEVAQGGASVPVGVMVTHGVGSVVALLGLVRAGRIIVALDPFLPDARLQHVLSLAGIVDVIADEEHTEQASALVADPAMILPFGSLLAEARSIATSGAEISEVPGAASRGGRDALDIIFTSGSTGAPKGVVMTHRQAIADAAAERATFRLVPEDRVASVLPHGFAAGFMLVLSSLLAGASVHLADPRHTGIDRLVTWIATSRLTTLHTTPHLVRSLVGALVPTEERLQGLRMVATVGEAITGPDVAALRPLLGATASFFNWTGSSETNVYAVNEIAPGDPIPERSIPSGRIVVGKRVDLRRADGTLADIGETGEIICISDAMTSGYWGAPEQTATRTGVAEDGTPTWAVGDLGRFDEEGRLTLLGRADDAVKVRGYLVEPSEVEAALRTVDTVQEAAVIAVKAPPAPTRLVAYVVTRQGRRSASPAAIRNALRALLPDYMVPTAIVPISALPRNERGKVDRARLPEAPSLAMMLGEDVGAFTADTYDQWELAVAQIWADVLGLPTVGPLQLPAVGLDNDFSALGGDSLSAEEMLAAVGDQIGVHLPSSELLAYPTVRLFAARIRLGAAAVPSHPDVVTLAGGVGRTGEPLFCVAGAGALALTYAPLTRHLGDRPVFAFQQHGIERRSVPDWSIPAMARRYTELMRLIQPRGPYSLVGHSFGGLVALEMAAMLTAAGEEVRQVVLLDTFLPEQAAKQADTVEFGVMNSAQPEARSTNGFGRVLSGLIDTFRKRFVGPFGQLGRRARTYGAGMFRWKGQRQFRAFFDHALVVSRRYRPPVYAGPVTLVIADGNDTGAARWAPFLVGQVAEIRLHAEHTSVLREPYVADLAAAMAESLAVAPSKLAES